jgi:hypothetical protein
VNGLVTSQFDARGLEKAVYNEIMRSKSLVEIDLAVQL